MWAKEMLAIAGGQDGGQLPCAVAWPQNTGEVQKVLVFAAQHGLSVTPFGGGSGVTGGAMPTEAGLLLDLKRLRFFEIDRGSLCVRVGAGWNGWHLEQQLNRNGLTVGHFPSSIMCSTVGGWVATRGAGQMSSKYGKIEDMVSALTIVTGAGETLKVPSYGAGADLLQLFIGSEGRFGVVTEVTLSVMPLPARRLLRGYWFPDVKSGCEAMRQVLQLGLRPAVLRLYDEVDTLVAGIGQKRWKQPPGQQNGLPLSRFLSGIFKTGSGQPLDVHELLQLLKPDTERFLAHGERIVLSRLLQHPAQVGKLADYPLSRWQVGCLLIVGCEGEPATTAREEQLVRDEILRCGGRDLGPEPGEHWLRHRYDVSFKWSRVLGAGAIADTMEFATPWDRLMSLYGKVRSAVRPHALIMAHLSHAYPDGCSIYFTFLARGKGRNADPEPKNHKTACILDDQRRYTEIWHAGIRAALSVGATMGHHHGVGRLRAPFQNEEQGALLLASQALLKAADPQGLLNPGRLFLNEEARLSSHRVTVPQRLHVDEENLLVRASADLSLGEIERDLRSKGLSLGALPPFAYQTKLAAALAEPSLSLAGLVSGKFSDRRLQLYVLHTLSQGEKRVWLLPPRAVPRRSTGPDLGQVFGQDLCPSNCEIVGATLRIEKYVPNRPWSVAYFAQLGDALAALHKLRRFHGGTGIYQLLLFSRGLCDRFGPLHENSEFALFIEGAGPSSLAREVVRELCDRLSVPAKGEEPGPGLFATRIVTSFGIVPPAPTSVAAQWPAPSPAKPRGPAQHIERFANTWNRKTQELCQPWDGPKLVFVPVVGHTLAQQVAELSALSEHFVVAGVHRHGLAVGLEANAQATASKESDAHTAFSALRQSRFHQDAAAALAASWNEKGPV